MINESEIIELTKSADIKTAAHKVLSMGPDKIIIKLGSKGAKCFSNNEEISIGDFVLTGGEIAAQALIDATVRLIPNVLGNVESAKDESHSNGLLEHPQYTKPAEWSGRRIPEVLLSGHHANVEKWRTEMSKKITKERRPDLWEKFDELNEKD